MSLTSCDSLIPHWDWYSNKKSRPLTPAPFLGVGADTKKTPPNLKLGFSDCRPACLNFKIRREWTLRAITPVDDEVPTTQQVAQVPTEIAPSTQFHNNFNFLPKPLSATTPSSDGANYRVAYQGIPGAYSETAALKAFPQSVTVPCKEFEAVFKAVERWFVDRAVLPIENSVAGSIHRNYDLLLRHRLSIVGEVQLRVNHCLLGLPGVRKEELKHVVSHPQALAQCKIILNELGVTEVNAVDTAVAAQMVGSEGLRETGAIASAQAAAIYGLDVLEEGIQDNSYNVTRFMILARQPIIPGREGSYKTSIVFTLQEGPGALFKALAVFAMRGINLSKIESRPQKMWPLWVVDDSKKQRAKYFEYLFYIDFEASMAEHRAQYALAHLQEFARYIRVLGCYPRDMM
ncbi:arogenate dehydratase/prephenate dehydratase 1, chloroplastic-like [Salvia splendens]|uniref:arogenate dehydratase/prephenate dehydratase 1, chloroplastic-like n=1 Tax=Salvia splendens TaxID=180675 RepID=UPI001C260A2E|nr:arogenate dehydratase/prephenate dehydratase 1, chloroplastic-like [Salvia splendens]